MEIRWIEALLAVTDLGTFTAAARRLGSSKQTVSRHVTQLEERVGAALLVRTSGTSSLTPQGRAFVEHARGALVALDAARASVKRREDSLVDHLRIGTPAPRYRNVRGAAG